MIGILCKFECPSCGNIISVNSPFWSKDLRKKVAEPKKCGCGRKGSFTMLSFKQCQYEIVPEGYRVVKTESGEKEAAQVTPEE